MKKDFIFEIYKNSKTVFSFKDIALIMNETNADALKSKIHYYVKTGKLRALRKGVYAKPDYNALELAAKIYSPAYISLETVLQREGIIFQHDTCIYAVSYISRTIEICRHCIVMRKIKNEALYNNRGIIISDHVPMATKERAFLDTLYLYKNYHFDNPGSLKIQDVKMLLPVYQSHTLNKKVSALLNLC
ncbi:MAG: hypothetical protein K8S27_11385 [Candidatus Omnitrophica bacterium]|nr:hypothetical protein [Candidatus Omnitrophota bacterium]